MNSRLINVELDSERLRKTRVFRELGVKLSDVVRDSKDTRAVPDPAGLPPRDCDIHDRAAARQAILRKLRPSR